MQGRETWNETIMVRWRAIATMFCFGLASCGLDNQLEGCGAESDALAAEGLRDSADAEFDIAGLAMPLPEGWMYRIRGNVLELARAPGIYCDSGDWDLLQQGFVRLQVHTGTVPVDAFRNFPDTHRGYIREQIDYAPVNPLDYAFTHNGLTWHVRTYLSGVYYPRVRLMYFRTEASIDDRKIGPSIHYCPRYGKEHVSQIIAAIDTVIREAQRPEQ